MASSEEYFGFRNQEGEGLEEIVDSGDFDSDLEAGGQMQEIARRTEEFSFDKKFISAVRALISSCLWGIIIQK